MIDRHTYLCPYTRIEKHEIGDFKKDKNGRERYVVNRRWEEEVPCGETKFQIISQPFDKHSGLDPNLLQVRCIRCGKESYLILTYKDGHMIYSTKEAPHAR